MGSPSYQELAQKAAFVSTDLYGGTEGGYLSNGQIDRFLKEWADTETLFSIIPMEDTDHQISELSFATISSRMFHPATAATASTAGQQSKPTTRKVEFAVKKVKATIPVDDDVFEDNIARGNFDPFLRELIKERGALDLEEYCLLADSESGDEELAGVGFDGFLAQANAVDGASVITSAADIGKSPLAQMLRTLPAKYKAQRTDLIFLCSHTFWEGYTDALSNRSTNLGDASLTMNPQGNGAIRFKGVPLYPVPNMPDSTLLLTPKANMKVRVLRKMKMATERSEQEEVTYYVVTCRLVPKFLDVAAVVKHTGVTTDVATS